VISLVRSVEPIARARRLLGQLRIMPSVKVSLEDAQRPVRAAFLVRDNLRQRRSIQRAYIEGIRHAQRRVDLVCPYFYPGRAFRRALIKAARRGVRVRLLLQGKVDYRVAGLAARVLYHELLAEGVLIHEYLPAFLHAKAAVVDDNWATLGSSNIDPLSLLVNLEANVVIDDELFAAELSRAFERALAVSSQITVAPFQKGALAVLGRGFIAWGAHLYLRMAGLSGKY
jgi:cardiolipin synthase A/B